MKKRVIVLGSTGSVGRNTLDVLSELQDEWEVVGLAAGSLSPQLIHQVNRLVPRAVAVARHPSDGPTRATLACQPRFLSGPGALEELVSSVPCDCVVSAVVGVEALSATLRAAELGLRVALANKEVMVIAGELMMRTVREHGATIIPVDSEHSAIFQALQAGRSDEVRIVHLTASGGPFWTWTGERMAAITLEDTLQHPTWSMGPKITIDSATMMNKALEIIEACRLFDLHPEQVKVLVHPESIVHSIVEYCDGSLIAQMGAPDMRGPIQYALTYPDRKPGPTRRLNLSSVGRLNFHPPDLERFPAITLGYESVRRGGTAGAALNAANETAVSLFRDGVISFQEITRLTRRVLEEHEFISAPTLNELMTTDRLAREEVARCLAC